MHAIITNKAYRINMNRIAKTILTFLPKLATYHYFSPFLSSTKSLNKVYKGNTWYQKFKKINNKHDMISHRNKYPSFSFKNIFQIKDCSTLEHSQFKAWFGKICGRTYAFKKIYNMHWITLLEHTSIWSFNFT